MPSEIGTMSSLEFLNVEMNELEGPLPPSIGNLGNLKVSRLFNLIPSSISSRALIASYFQLVAQSITLSKNFFNDVLPSNVGNLENLNKFIATDNLFSGKSSYYKSPVYKCLLA